MIRVHDRNLEAARHVDEATHALVPETGAPETLPTDPKHLETMFVFCSNNWRTYTGDKPTGDKLVRAVHSSNMPSTCSFSNSKLFNTSFMFNTLFMQIDFVQQVLAAVRNTRFDESGVAC